MMRVRMVFTAIAVFLSLRCGAQSQNITISRKDYNNIAEQAKKTLQNYETDLQLLDDRSAPESEIEDILNDAFAAGTSNTIFLNERVQVDDETDPEADPEHPKQYADMKEYLRSLRVKFKQRGDSKILCKQTGDLSDIRILPSGDWELRLYFTQVMDGTYADNRKSAPKKFQKQMILVVSKDEASGRWQTRIRRVEFVARPDGTADAPKVNISRRASDNGQDKTAKQSEAFYAAALQQGKSKMAQGDYPGAYFYFLEAKGGRATEEEASKQISELCSQIRGKGENPVDVGFNYFIKKANDAQKNYRYDNARKYFEYAHLVNNASTAPTDYLSELSLQEDHRKQLFKKLERGASSEASATEALNAFKSEAAKKPGDPYWQAGIGLAYAGLGKRAEANAAFDKAIKLAPSDPNIYRYDAACFRLQHDYDNAYAALRNVQINAADPQEPALLAEIAYCKGKTALLALDARAALDSFRRAELYLPAFTDAKIGQAEALASTYIRDNKAAQEIIDKVLEEDQTQGDAWYVRSIICQKNGKMDDAVSALISATRYRKDNAQYFFELGDLLLGQSKFSDAITAFVECTNTINPVFYPKAAKKESDIRRRAVWKIAKSYYLLKQYDKAKENYERCLAGYHHDARGEIDEFLPVDFIADISNFYLNEGNLKEAQSWLDKVEKHIASTQLSRGILSYRKKEPPSFYEPWIEKALSSGLSQSQFENAPFAKDIYDESKHIRQLVSNKWPNLKLKS